MRHFPRLRPYPIHCSRRGTDNDKPPAAGAIGFARLKVDDSLSQLFRSDTPEYQTYAEVTRRFPASEYDVLVVIDGDALLTRLSLEKLRELAIDLQLIDGTRGLISIFSAREPQRNGGEDKVTAFRDALYIVGPAGRRTPPPAFIVDSLQTPVTRPRSYSTLLRRSKL